MRIKSFPGRVIFDHLPKTAGMAVNAWLRGTLGVYCVTDNLIDEHENLIRRFGGEYSIISGHILFQGEKLNPRYDYVTCFREPIDRTISWIFFVLENHGEDEIVETRANIRQFLETEGNECEEYVLQHISNLMTSHLCSIYGIPLPETSEDLEKVLEIVDEYALWGLYERLPDFIYDFATFLEIPPPTQLVPVNITRRRPKVSEISPRLRARIEELNAIDIALYDQLKIRYDKSRQRWQKPAITAPKWKPLQQKPDFSRQFSHTDFTLISISHPDKVIQNTALSFSVKFSLTRSIEDLICGIKIYDATGILVFGTNSTLKNTTIGPLSAGTHNIRHTIVAALAEGKYTVGFAFIEKTNNSEQDLFWFDNIGAFEIVQQENSSYTGYVNLPITINHSLIDQNIQHLPSDGYGKISFNSSTKIALVNQRWHQSVILHNQSKQTWFSLQLNPIVISYHWLNEKNEIVVFDGERTSLSQEKIVPGESIEAQVIVQSPSEPGRYFLQIMPVSEGHVWFNEIGFIPGEIQIEIIDSPPNQQMPESARVEMTVSCSDCATIPKVENAGLVFDENGQKLQLMHDGTRVVAGGYFGDWMQEIITRLQGHHEPQEELAFHHILKHARPDSLMIELGCYWAYYSNWFIGSVKNGQAICIEPDENRLEIGKKNLALNNRFAEFHVAAIGGQYRENTVFTRESDSKTVKIPLWDFGKVLETAKGKCIEVLHLDIQGTELPFLKSIANIDYQNRLRFVIVSTHHQLISGSSTTHRDCLATLIDLGAFILTEHAVDESYSGDGLIVASFLPEDKTLVFPVISHNTPENSLFGADPKRAVSPYQHFSLTTRQKLIDNIELTEKINTLTGPMLIYKNDFIIGKALREQGKFETQKVDEVVSFLKSIHLFAPQCFIDIGANIGTHIIHALKKSGFENGFAIEPDPSNYALLRKNISLNQLDFRVKVLEVALSNRSGAATLEKDHQNFGDHRVRMICPKTEIDFGENQREILSVLQDTGDKLFSEYNFEFDHNTLVWIDAQGHEGHILEGLTNLISQQRIKFLVCEFWPYGLERANGKEKFFKFIKKFSAIYDLAKPRWKDLPPISYEDLEKSYAKMLQETDQSHYPHTDLLCIL